MAVGGDLGENTLINSLQNSLGSRHAKKSEEPLLWRWGWRWGVGSKVEAGSFDGVPKGILPHPTFKFTSSSNCASPRIYEWGAAAGFLGIPLHPPPPAAGQV